MRERLAQWLAVATGLLLLALAATLAGWHSHGPAPPATAVSPELLTHGTQVYAEQGCARCHSLAGKGNPRLPLDAVGSRRDAVALRHGITGDVATGAALSARVRAVKAGYAQLPDTDMAALIAYLQSVPQATTAR